MSDSQACYLLIDVGNGRTKLGLSDESKILDTFTVSTSSIIENAKFALRILPWQTDSLKVILSSVVPEASISLIELFGSQLLELKHNIALGIGIDYPQPERIGADRLANAVALSHLYGAPGIVIDFGTAVTFDILRDDHFYIGGVIAPGLRLMTDYLHERTALLPHVDLKEPEHAIGQSTEEAILSGAAIGYRGMITGILEAIRKELGNPKDLTIVSTGGDAAWIVSGLKQNHEVNQDLTLQGLRLVGNLHKQI